MGGGGEGAGGSTDSRISYDRFPCPPRWTTCAVDAIAQWLACRAHNSKIVGSNPSCVVWGRAEQEWAGAPLERSQGTHPWYFASIDTILCNKSPFFSAVCACMTVRAVFIHTCKSCGTFLGHTMCLAPMPTSTVFSPVPLVSWAWGGLGCHRWMGCFERHPEFQATENGSPCRLPQGGVIADLFE